MGIVLLIKGIIIGLVASIPLGPIGVMCIQRTLSKNQRAGFASGLGASLTDTLFGAVALFSLSAVTSVVENYMVIVKAIGGIVVIMIGTTIFLKNPVLQIRQNRAGKETLWSDFISIFFMTLANPFLILVYAALIAAFGVTYNGHNRGGSLLMLLGVFVGATLWWFTLTFFVNLFRHKFRPRHLLWINRISGALIVTLGGAAILSIFLNPFPNYGVLP